MENHKSAISNQEKILHVIKELEQNPHTTQRDLAQKLGISLGKVNFLLTELLKKGVIEVKNFKNSKNKLSYTYLLTKQGIRTKIELVRQFFIWKTQEYEKIKEEIELLKKEVCLIESGRGTEP